jgi:hypothetical protein
MGGLFGIPDVEFYMIRAQQRQKIIHSGIVEDTKIA